MNRRLGYISLALLLLLFVGCGAYLYFDWEGTPVVQPHARDDHEVVAARPYPLDSVPEQDSAARVPEREYKSAETEDPEKPENEEPSASTPDYKPAWKWEDQLVQRYSEGRDGSASVRLHGTVLDSAGRPVAGAQVAVVSSESSDKYRTQGGLMVLGTTGEDGVFENSYGLRGTSVVFEIELRARRNGLESVPLKLAVTPGEVLDDIIIRMPEGLSISGFVVDGSRLPIANAMITLLLAEHPRDPFKLLARPTVKTDLRGGFSFTQLAPGNYTIHASSPGYSSTSTSVKLDEESVHLEQELVLVSRTSIRLRLVCDGVPVPGGFVAILYLVTGEAVELVSLADADGNALLANIRADTTEVVIRVPGYQDTGRVPVSPVEGAHTDIGDVVLERRH